MEIFLGIAAELLNIRFGYFYTILNDGTYVRNRELVALAFLPFVTSIWYTVTGLPPTFFIALFFKIFTNLNL